MTSPEHITDCEKQSVAIGCFTPLRTSNQLCVSNPRGGDLLSARITIGTTERKNPGRFRERIEAALDSLQKLEQPVIKSWRYLDKVPETGRGMLEQWQRARIVCVPADDLTTKYRELNAKGKTARTLSRKRGR